MFLLILPILGHVVIVAISWDSYTSDAVDMTPFCATNDDQNDKFGSMTTLCYNVKIL